MNCCNASLLFLGRLCLSAIFILAGINKFMDPSGTAAYMAAKGMSMIPFFLYSAAVIEIAGGLSLLIGFKARWGALLLILFLIPTTLIFSSFWNEPAETYNLQMIEFLKNLGIIGGLLYVLATGAGKWSFDHCCETSCCKK